MIKGIGFKHVQVTGAAVEHGGFLNIDTDLSQIGEFDAKIARLVIAFSKLPEKIAGGYKGKPPLIDILKALTPKDTRRGKWTRKPGPHLRDGWVSSVVKSNPQGDVPGAVTIYNTGEKASKKILLFLDKGVKRHDIIGSPLLKFWYKNHWWSKRKVTHPGFVGRNFMGAIKKEANLRAKDYISNMYAKAKSREGV